MTADKYYGPIEVTELEANKETARMVREVEIELAGKVKAQLRDLRVKPLKARQKWPSRSSRGPNSAGVGKPR